MKKIITAAAIAAIMGASSVAVAEWDMPFFGDDNDSYNDGRWNNDGYGYGDGSGRGRGKGRGNFSMNMSGDADTDWEGDGSSYGRGYNNWDNRYYNSNRYGNAPYGYGPRPMMPYAPAPVQAPAAPQAPAATGNCAQ